MKICELDRSYKIQRNLSKMLSVFDEQGKFFDSISRHIDKLINEYL